MGWADGNNLDAGIWPGARDDDDIEVDRRAAVHGYGHA